MEPFIGVTPSIENNSQQHFVNVDHITAIRAAGGIPIILPYVQDEAYIAQIANRLDGLYVSGGNDIDPQLLKEEPHPKLREVNAVRDHVEFLLITAMLNMDKPILGVCKGCQMINVTMGGDMYQDIYTQKGKNVLQHDQLADGIFHEINIVRGSLLHRIIDKLNIQVNSRHHQANRQPGKNLKHSAYAVDGVVEATESSKHRFVLGLQWHPENMAVKEDEDMKKIYRHFVKACRNMS